MPSSTQIIPKYKHPHVEEYINDNTLIPDDGFVIEEFDGVNTLILTTADKGRDNTLVDIRSVSQLVDEFGYPNMKKHGQPLYNAYKYLSQVNYNRRAFVMRVLPEDAAYANAVVVARVKTTAGIPAAEGVPATPGSLSVKIEVQSTEDLTDTDDLAAEFATIRNSKADADGYKAYPLFAVLSNGRGEFGNSTRFRVTKNTSADEENIYTNYFLQLYDLTAEGLKVKKTVTGSLYEGALEGSKSLNLEDIIAGADDTNIKVQFLIDQDSLDELYELYVETVGGDDLVEQDEFDYLYGYKRNSKDLIPGYTIEVPAESDISLDIADGVPLTNGNDGALDPAKLKADTSRTREEIVEELFGQAILGTFDRRIRSRRRTPLHFVVDANYPESVKTALSELCATRRDFQLILDAGLNPTLAACVEWVNDYEVPLEEYRISQEVSNLKIRDPYTGKKVQVTSTYILIGQLVEVFADTENLARAITGPRAVLVDSEIVPNTLVPDIDEDDNDLKEKFYTKNVNIYVSSGEKTSSRLSQQTIQTKQTDLSEESNVRVLLDISRKVRNFCTNLLYSTTQESDIANYNEQIGTYANLWFPTLIQTVQLSFAQSEWEKQRNILHCYVAVVFKGLGKRVILEIDVNPRD